MKTNMSKIKSINIALSVVLLLAACGQVVDEGNVGVVTNRDGIAKEVVQPGRHSPGMGATIHKFSTRTQTSYFTANVNEGDRQGDDSIKASSSEGATVNMDVQISYRVNGGDAAAIKSLYSKGVADDTALRDVIIRKNVQSKLAIVAGKYAAKDLKSAKRGEVQGETLTLLQESVTKDTFGAVSVESVLVTDVRLPENIQAQVDQSLQAEAEAQKKAIERKQQETQAETERLVAQKKAETDKIKAEGDAQARLSAAKADAEARTIAAEAEAESNRKIAESLTPELARLKIAQACAEAIGRTSAAVVNGCDGSGNSGSNNSGGGQTVIVDGRK